MVIQKAIKGEGGRARLCAVLGRASKTVDRKLRGETSFYVTELEIIAHELQTTSTDLIRAALAKFGGIEKLIASQQKATSELIGDLLAFEARGG